MNKITEALNKLPLTTIRSGGIALSDWTPYTKSEQDLTDSLPKNCSIEFNKKEKKFRLIVKYHGKTNHQNTI